MKRDVLRAVFLGAAYVLTASVLFGIFRSLAAAERGGPGVGGEIMAFVLPAVFYIIYINCKDTLAMFRAGRK